MRSEAAILSLVLEVATNDERIRAVLLTGSRANPDAAKDSLQDFDVIYIVTEVASFTNNHNWINIFGERLLMQLPDEMTIGVKDPHAFHYLMLFTDGNRIDLTLLPQDQSAILLRESLLKLLLNKDGIIPHLPSPGNKNYLIQSPGEKIFKDCCNEFWWVSTYVAKGLWRSEVLYAKAMLEGVVRKMFLQIVEWYIGVNTNFTAAFNKGRDVQQYLAPELYNRLLATYPNSNTAAIWNALFHMAELFDELANAIADKFNFNCNKEEAANALSYLKYVYTMPVKN